MNLGDIGIIKDYSYLRFIYFIINFFHISHSIIPIHYRFYILGIHILVGKVVSNLSVGVLRLKLRISLLLMITPH
jgi:hypothetical protein